MRQRIHLMTSMAYGRASRLRRRPRRPQLAQPWLRPTAQPETSHAPASILADIPAKMPAFTRAVKLQEKAAKVGFDWPSLAPVFDKAREELAEFEEVALPYDPRQPKAGAAADDLPLTDAAIKEEFGDLMFVMANVARHLKIDPEGALRSANQKFVRRFAYIEQQLAAKGSSPSRSSLAEMDTLWDEAKARERSP